MEEINHQFDSEEFLKLSRDLEKYHSVFYRLWNLGKPMYSDKIQTAAVEFDKLGDTINFMINYEFWSKLTWPEKQFIICHECLHVILNHGIRIKNMATINMAPINQALDIVVNHSLVDRFGFKREEVDKDNKFCWTNTVFPDKKDVPTDKAFEFYYNLFPKSDEGGSSGDKIDVSGSSGKTVDDHSKMEDFGELIKKLNEEMGEQEKQALKGMIEKHYTKDEGDGTDPGGQKTGTQAGSLWIFVDVGKVQKRKKWETVIKNWCRKHEKDKSEDQWCRTNRRIFTFKGDLMLPSEAEVDAFDKDKINLAFFLDTSGSCRHLAERFFKAAVSLPTDRFNIELFCFDTRVYEVDIKKKQLYGFGGTSFSCIESYIQERIKKDNIRYYDRVFVTTDGFGNNIYPQFPKKWSWFLSCDYRHYIPKESQIYMLKDFE